MAIAKLEKSTWRAYFDHVSKTLEGKQAEIEVSSLSLGNQIEAEWVPLLGMVYDPKSDVVEIVLEGLDHLIHQPQALYVDQDAMELLSLQIIDQDDTRQIIRLRNPLMLPAPWTSPGAGANPAGGATRH